MEKIIALLLFVVVSCAVFGQKDTSKQDTIVKLCPPPFRFGKKDSSYNKFYKDSCDKQFLDYCGTKDAKKLFCEANYYIAIKVYQFALDDLRCAYTEANCGEFKFQILKRIQQVYGLWGDEIRANEYQQLIDKILKNNPSIDKHNAN